MIKSLPQLTEALQVVLTEVVTNSQVVDISSYQGEQTIKRNLAISKWVQQRLKEVKNMQAGRYPDEDFEGQRRYD